MDGVWDVPQNRAGEGPGHLRAQVIQSEMGEELFHGSVAQSCLTLCDPRDCNLLGFSVHGILQERILEWIAIPFSRGSFQPRD